MEASLKAQTVQVFIEGLGTLKDIIKARDPPTLEKAIQAAREEERVRESNEQTKRLLGTKQKTNSMVTKLITCFNCNRTGNIPKNRHEEEKRIRKPQTNSFVKSIQNLIFSCYCKKPRHSIEDCRKRKYVNPWNPWKTVHGSKLGHNQL